MLNAIRRLGVASVLAAVVVSAPAIAGVANGGFESGDTGFSSNYGDVTGGDCGPAAIYAIVNAPHDCHVAWAGYGPHSGSSQMAVNGGSDASQAFWFETIAVAPGTTYLFTAWGASAFSGSPATIDFQANGSSLGTLALSGTTGDWTEFSGVWNSGANNSVTLAMYDLVTEPFGNDFSIDDISLDARGGGSVPEPMTLALFGSGLAGLSTLRRKHKTK